MNRTLIYFILVIAIAFCSCSTTKRISDGEILYTGVKKMKIESGTDEKVPSSVKSAVKDPLNVKPNNPLYSPYVRTPIPTGLWVWNYFYTERKTGFKAWIYRSFAKKPVLISDVQPDLRMGLVKDILDNHGYFGSSADYELIPKKNPKKARLSYFVNVAEPWFYSNVDYPAVECPVTAMIDTMQNSSNLKQGEQYNIDTLTRERIRITNVLREQSYYYFRPDYLEYLADTVQERYKVDLRMVLTNGTPPAALKQYQIGDVRVQLFNTSGGEADSMYIKDVKVWYQKPLKVRKKVLEKSVTIHPGDPARVSEINQTLNNFTKLGIFRYVNMNVTPMDSITVEDSSLDMTLSAGLDSPLEAELEVDFSSKSNSFIGPGAVFNVRHKNLFRGGEVFSFRINGAYEWQTGNSSSQANSTSVNSYELGVNASLIVPRLIVPRFISRDAKKYDSRTTFNLGGTLLNRPKFFTLVSYNASLAYDFQTSPYSFHNLVPIKIAYNKLLKTTPDFDSTMNRNPAIAQSFQNQFIPSASYTYTYNKPYGRMNRHRVIWQSTVTSAGNLLSLGYGAVGSKVPKKIFGNQFSQFAKVLTEIKNYYQVGTNNTIASRIILGVGYAYGNSEVLPYSEQFYVGGANSIRAFTVRSIGPGNYRSPDDDIFGYFDQTGDIKFEANIEFRFKIAGGLNGAAFFDAGNVWLVRKDPSRPGGVFKFGNFFNQLATGTGAGLRYDITYLVIRADLGIGIHTPYKNPDKSGYYNISRFKDGLGFHLAIGYPF